MSAYRDEQEALRRRLEELVERAAEAEGKAGRLEQELGDKERAVAKLTDELQRVHVLLPDLPPAAVRRCPACQLPNDTAAEACAGCHASLKGAPLRVTPPPLRELPPLTRHDLPYLRPAYGAPPPPPEGMAPAASPRIGLTVAVSILMIVVLVLALFW